MKKFLAILLAMMLVMVSVAAMADDGDPETNSDPYDHVPLDYYLDDPEPTAPQTLTIAKEYTITVPADVLKDDDLLKLYSLSADSITFTASGKNVANSEQPTAPAVSVTMNTRTEEYIDPDKDYDETTGKITKEFPLTLTIPAYTEVGIYEYTIYEEGNYQGVGYTYTKTAPMYLRVTVTRENVEDETSGESVSKLQIKGIALRSTSAEDTTQSTKTDTFANTYDTGRLAVTKLVSGNLGDRTQDFKVTVTFTSDKPVGATISYSDPDNSENEGNITFVPKTVDGTTKYVGSADLQIHHEEVVQFENIPAGVVYNVEEDTTDDSVVKVYDYDTPEYESEKGTIAKAGDVTAKVKNNRETIPDTGITLETLPYVLMMALAMMGLVALKLRKREEY